MLAPVGMFGSRAAGTLEQAIFGASAYEAWESETNVATTGADVDSWTGMIRGKVFLPTGDDGPPAVVAGGLNGFDYISFAHNQDRKLAAAFGESLPQPLTYLSVFTWTAVAANNSAYIIGGTPDPGTGAPETPRLGISSGNVLWTTSALDVFNVNGAGGWLDSHILFAIASGAGGVARVYRNGILSGAGGVPTDTSSITGLSLAADVGFSQANALRFYRVAVLTSFPSDMQLNDYGAAMNATYGLAYTPI